MSNATSIGPHDRIGPQQKAPVDQGVPLPTSKPVRAGPRPAVLIVAGAVCVLALLMVAGGAWALWMDRVERDSSGFLSVGTTKLDTETYSLVSELRGDGPRWLYGSTVLGKARVRATSQNDQTLFIGIARTDQVSRYLEGTAYATIEHLESGAVTTRAGGAPSVPPSQASIWAASTEGTGEQTLLWKPRDGDWSIVLMNSNASAGVAIRGDVSGKVPLLPWISGVLLGIGAAFAVLSGWLLLREIRGETGPSRLAGEQSPGRTSTHVQPGR